MARFPTPFFPAIHPSLEIEKIVIRNDWVSYLDVQHKLDLNFHGAWCSNDHVSTHVIASAICASGKNITVWQKATLIFDNLGDYFWNAIVMLPISAINTRYWSGTEFPSKVCPRGQNEIATCPGNTYCMRDILSLLRHFFHCTVMLPISAMSTRYWSGSEFPS